MKKSLLIISALILLNLVSATLTPSCELRVDLFNQDPYPAVPGDYVKVIFQVRGVENSACRDVVFSIVPEYPFSLDTDKSSSITIKGGTYTNDYNAFLMVPYTLRVNKDAIEGYNALKIKYSTDRTLSSFVTEDFDIKVEDVKTDFQIFVRDYDSMKNTITFEILNSGKNDVEALVFKIPKQENIVVRRSSTNIIGSLDSNDFTTTNFEAVPSNGEIKIELEYTDSINKRRIYETSVVFDKEYFQGLKRDEKTRSTTTIILSLLVVGGIGYYFYNRRQKAKKKKKLFDN